MKKLLILLLTLILSISAVGLVACGGRADPGEGEGPSVETPPAYSVTGTEGLAYSEAVDSSTGEKFARFTGLKRDCTATEITIASHYNGLPVKEIGFFGKLSNIDKVEKINVHKLITIVGASVFYEAQSLVEVNFDKDTVLEEIGNYAFEDCAKLEKINLPSTIKSLGEGVFDGCSLLTYNEYEGAKYIGSTEKPYMLMMKGSDTATSCKVHEDCQVIYASAFENNKNLVSITFESDNGLYSIGDNAFKGSAIKNITIPASVETIGAQAFMECTSLTEVNLSTNTKITFIGEKAFESCTSLQKVNNFEKCRLTYIYAKVFYKCTSLQSIVIPNTVIEMHSMLFQNCDSLASVEFENGSQIQRFEQGIFVECKRLTQLVLPRTLVSVEWSMVRGCSPSLKIFLENVQQPTGYEKSWNAYEYHSDANNVYTYNRCKTYYYRDSRPTEQGNFWHYVDGKPVIWN